eukprot:757279-Hanusia_phi.AAC.3
MPAPALLTDCPQDYHTLAKPVLDKLYFAGEHTCWTHPSQVSQSDSLLLPSQVQQVVGAALSGLRAAGELSYDFRRRGEQRREEE